LEDDKVDKEAGKDGEFFGDDVGYLSSIFCESPDIGERPKNEVDDKVDE
jgi:hypothetical protein